MARLLRLFFPLALPVCWIACSDAPPKPRGGGRLGAHSEALTPSGGEPILDFDENANPDEIALTFDDGPDTAGNTESVLNTLQAAGVHATFFINTINFSTVSSDPAAQALITRMQNDGHHVGNHTVHHYDLNNTSVDVNSEIDGVYQALQMYAPDALQQRLFRAPFGNPYFGPQARLDELSPIVANYGVHIGWNIDSNDWNCGSASCVTTNVLNDVDSGKSGILLLHCVNQYTASALPDLINSLKSRGKNFIYVEDLVVRKYGLPSRDLINCSSDSTCVSGETCQSGHCAPGGGATDAGTDTEPDDTGPDDTGP